MRIIGGELGGRRLSGKVPPGTRPTADSTREAIFNILQFNIELEGLEMLDLCAGTGALSFEAISRGAVYSVMVDKSGKALAFIKNAAKELGIDKEKYKVIKANALTFLDGIRVIYPGKKFGFIITDPPYDLDITENLLEKIMKYELLMPGGIFAAEVRSNSPDYEIGGMELIRSKKAGETRVDFWKRMP